MNIPAPVPNPCGPALAQWLVRWPVQAHTRVAVAYSAGADSTALLLAAHAHWPDRVAALHVHHGLQAAADGFEATARAVCRGLNIPLLVAHVQAAPTPGQSPEDAARTHRYAALADLAREADAGARRNAVVGSKGQMLYQDHVPGGLQIADGLVHGDAP